MSFAGRVWYRCRQFAGELVARPLSAAAMGEVQALLSVEEARLFDQFSLSDQNHSFAVMKTLQKAGCQDELLLKAALLHDIGKTLVPVYLWDRVAIVLAGAIMPNQVKKWSRGEPIGWRRPFVMKTMHPEWGARMAARIGCEKSLVELIRLHQTPVELIENPKIANTIRRLQWADEQH